MCVLAGLKNVILSFRKELLNACSEINSWCCSLVLESLKEKVLFLKSEAGSRFQPSSTEDLLEERIWRGGKPHWWKRHGVITRVADLGHRWTAISPDQISDHTSSFITDKGELWEKKKPPKMSVFMHMLWPVADPAIGYLGCESDLSVCMAWLFFITVYFSWS